LLILTFRRDFLTYFFSTSFLKPDDFAAMKLFVYGTLMRGMSRHRYLKHSRYLGAARLQAELYDLGRYPGIKAGSLSVLGELYEIDAQTLAQIDTVEDYKPDDEMNSLYVRRLVEVTCLSDASTTMAFAYFYNGSVHEHWRIAHGDYRQYYSSMRESSKKL
jgi:gamma-glutamylcyclotransferase (GGCT)/AIG2-like uncharacterized protein YtfP